MGAAFLWGNKRGKFRSINILFPNCNPTKQKLTNYVIFNQWQIAFAINGYQVWNSFLRESRASIYICSLPLILVLSTFQTETVLKILSNSQATLSIFKNGAGSPGIDSTTFFRRFFKFSKVDNVFLWNKVRIKCRWVSCRIVI